MTKGEGSSIPSWARVGAKVVCIGRERKPGEPEIINDLGIRWKPTRGQTYTVSNTYVNEVYGGFIFLAEHAEHQCFHIEGFRPAVEPKTEAEDVQLFRKLLDVRQPVDA